MKGSTFIQISAIWSITVILVADLIYGGPDGTIIALALACIAGLGGYHLGKKYISNVP